MFKIFVHSFSTFLQYIDNNSVLMNTLVKNLKVHNSPTKRTLIKRQKGTNMCYSKIKCQVHPLGIEKLSSIQHTKFEGNFDLFIKCLQKKWPPILVSMDKFLMVKDYL